MVVIGQVHYSKQGQAFKSRAQSMHIEILQSPWLCELMAFHINLRDKKAKTRMGSYLFEDCSLKFTDGKPSLTCELFDSVKVDLDLTCSICLVSILILYILMLFSFFTCTASNPSSFKRSWVYATEISTI